MTFKEWLNNPSLDQNLSIGCLGQSGYVLKKNETTILIDPYLTDYISHPDGLNDPKMKRQFPPVISPSEIQTVDAILCTHAHGDHMDPWTLESIKPRYKLYCTEAAFNNNPVNLDVDQLIWVDWEKPIAINENKGTCLFFHSRLIHGSSHNISPYDRKILLYDITTKKNFDDADLNRVRTYNRKIRKVFEKKELLKRLKSL